MIHPIHKVPEQVQLNFAIQRSRIDRVNHLLAPWVLSAVAPTVWHKQALLDLPIRHAIAHQSCVRNAVKLLVDANAIDVQMVSPEAPTDDGASIALSSDSAIVPSRAVVAHGGLQTPAMSRAYARPLDPTWGRGYYGANHLKVNTRVQV